MLVSANSVLAQTFSVPSDTVYGTWTTSNTSFFDKITNTGTSSINIKWQVIACTFPTDWADSATFGICDNNICYQNTGDTLLWNESAGTSGATNVTNSILPGAIGDFHVQMHLETASEGTHVVRVSLANNSGTGFPKIITFIITKGNLATPVIAQAPTEVSLYPNPASNEVNVVYGSNTDVKNIAIYNIIGKVMAVFKVGDNSANLNIENIPSGVYFARLINSQGEVVVTKKFTKQ